MTDPFENFDRDFARSERTFRFAFGLIVTVIVLIVVAVIAGGGMILWQLAHLTDDGIAKSLGHTANVFMKELNAK